MITESLLATGFILLAAVTSRFLPAKFVWTKRGVTILLFALLTAILFRGEGSPITPKFDLVSPGIALWQRLIAAAWWILGARVALIAGNTVVFSGGGSREAKLVSDLVSGAVYLAATLVIVKIVFDVPIGGLVATSGVIAIVLGLALQNTLADVFAGIAVGIERPVSVGDRIWLDGPLEGEIVQINWRSVRIRTDGNDIAVVPHSIIAKSRIINRSYPTRRRSDAVEVSCDPGAQPHHVTAVLERALLQCPLVLKDPAPSSALIRLEPRKSIYQVSFSVATSDILGDARSQLLTEIARHFRHEGLALTGKRPRETVDDAPAEGASEYAGYPAARLLGELSLFRELLPVQRRELATKMVSHFLEAQDIVFSQGAVDASMFMIASGVLEVTRESAERKLVIGRIGPGDYIGEIGLFTGAPHAATVTALTPCLVYELSKTDIAPLLTATPELVAAFEASARRGQELIARAAAAGVGAHAGPPGQLLDRIRAFFNLPS